ncbi:hypothetical protein Pcinc_014225 [Petrolisthes cinctipes]|uniref:Uncharacterized protein n=1 Tax=Petrolisthes cinctipes TaxID=88211 RepID=A0AAE1KPF7_PETCI|nr:hypothetical protein Pcinc_014225 [Petrolisthes cinctipes]
MIICHNKTAYYHDKLLVSANQKMYQEDNTHTHTLLSTQLLYNRTPMSHPSCPRRSNKGALKAPLGTDRVILPPLRLPSGREPHTPVLSAGGPLVNPPH